MSASHSSPTTAINLRGLPLLITVSPAKKYAFNSDMWQNAYDRNFKCTFEDSLPCYCYATKANDRTIRSPVSQPAPAGKEADQVNCELIAACYQNSEPDSCAVSVISANKLPLQKLTQLIRIKLLISRFLEIFAS